MKTYIYGLVDTRTQELRYIGKANSPKARLSDHLYNARAGRLTHAYRWIRGLMQENLQPELVVIAECEREDWVEQERFWIAYFRFVGADLTNQSGGGEGHGGVEVTLETRQKLSIAHKGKPLSDSHLASIKAAGFKRRGINNFPLEARKRAVENTVAKSAKTFVVCSPEGVEQTITNLKKFCRENGLNAGGMRQVLNGRVGHCKGWKVRRPEDAGFAYVPRAKGQGGVKSYLLTSPDGEILRVRNLRVWCLERGFRPSSFHEVLAGRQKKTHGGWAIQRLQTSEQFAR